MGAIVFIPTRNRRHTLAKTLPKWLMQKNLELLYLVVEPREYTETRRFVESFDDYRLRVLRLPKSDRGINYARNYIVSYAATWGEDKIIQSDDDVYPKPSDDVNRLFEWNGINTLGIGAMVPLYGLMFGNNTIKEADRPLMSRGALGKSLFSLNVPRVLAAGNFDVRFYSGWGDDELVRQGMASLQATWYVHAGVNATHVARRFTKGGMNDFYHEDVGARMRDQEHSHQMIYDKWGPLYISPPGKRMMCRWKAFMDDHVPDWEQRITWRKQ